MLYEPWLQLGCCPGYCPRKSRGMWGEKVLFCVLNLPRGVFPGFDRSTDHGIAGHVIGTGRLLRGTFLENIIIEEDVNRVGGVQQLNDARTAATRGKGEEDASTGFIAGP